MTDDVANLVPTQPRTIRSGMAGSRADIDALKEGVAEVRHTPCGLASLVAHAMGRLPDGEARVGRLEAR